ncbi:MAG TPA: LysE family transporter [Candidatus Angelobacter sp.]|nr:LysE family transporter [Candidatus Angelobacter sp.]
MSAILSYVLLGLSLAAPIGPINAAQMDRGLKGGFLPSWIFGLGAISADVLYMLMVYLGLVHFINVPVIKTFLWLFGSFVLFFTGIESLKGVGQLQVRDFRQSKEPLIKSYISGFLMSLSNPLTILFWIGIFGSVFAETASNFETHDLIIYSGSIFMGIFIWDISMAAISSGFRRLLTNGLIKFISIISGLSLIGFGFYFGKEGLKLFFK